MSVLKRTFRSLRNALLTVRAEPVVATHLLALTGCRPVQMPLAYCIKTVGFVVWSNGQIKSAVIALSPILLSLLHYLTNTFPWCSKSALPILIFSCSFISSSLQPHGQQHAMDSQGQHGFPVLQHLPEFVQTHVHWVDDAIQPSHLLSPPSPLVLSLSQNQGLFQWVGSLHQLAKDSSFSISPSNDYSGLVSFRIDWFDLLAVQGTLKSLI